MPAEPGRVILELTWQGLSSLHKGYFSNDAAIDVLTAGLGETVGRQTMKVQVEWDSEAQQGSIRLGLVGNELPGLFVGNAVQTAALVPLTRALAAYRDAVAGGFDIRVLSFRILVGVGDRCEVQVVGDYPPDGTQLSECRSLPRQ
jgi:hypothetical protein